MKKKADVEGKEGQEWLYSEKVKDHFFHPRNIFKSDAEEQEYEKNADGIGQVGSPACLTSEQTIVTDSGLAKIDQIFSNRYVLGYEGTFNKVKEQKSRKFVGDLIKFKSKLGEISLTPDHLVFSIRRPKSYKFDYTRNKTTLAPEWNPASKLKKNDFVIYPKLTATKDIEYINLNFVKKKGDFKSKDLPHKIKLDTELFRLFGYFVADGSTRKNDQESKEVLFTFSIKEKTLVDDTILLMKKYFNLDGKIEKKVKNHLCTIAFYSVHLSNLFKEWFGCGAKNKKLPEFFLYLPNLKQVELLKGLWLGDGYINLNRKFPRAGYSTISSQLANQIKIILLRHDIVSSVYYEREKKSKWANHKQAYRIHVGDNGSLNKLVDIILSNKIKFPVRQITSWFDQDFFYTPITKVNSVRFSGKVFNLEVNDSRTYTTEAFCVHNCGDVMRMYIKVDQKSNTLKECRWKTFGCGSAIASTSMLSVMAIGKTLEEAQKITPQDIVKELGGLPARKIHCSILGDQALRAAIEDYKKKKIKN